MVLLPRKVGPLTLMRKLGTDGVTESFAAILDEPAGKQVIARLVLPWITKDPTRGPGIESRLRDLAAIRHPVLVPVLDQLNINDERYLISDGVDAIDLQALLDHCRRTETQIPRNVFLNLATQVCNGLEALHSRSGADSGNASVLHLAMRPEAILLTTDGKVLIGEYGLLRSPTAVPAGSANVPTPRLEYLSPEQTHADQKLTPATDIFSLGAVLFEMLTLRPMFAGESSLGIIQKVRRAEVTTQLLEVKEALPGLDKVLYRALSLNPRHRYQRAFVLREDLRGLMAGFSFARIIDDTREFLAPAFAANAIQGPDPALSLQPPIPLNDLGPMGAGVAPTPMGRRVVPTPTPPPSRSWGGDFEGEEITALKRDPTPAPAAERWFTREDHETPVPPPAVPEAAFVPDPMDGLPASLPSDLHEIESSLPTNGFVDTSTPIQPTEEVAFQSDVAEAMQERLVAPSMPPTGSEQEGEAAKTAVQARPLPETEPPPDAFDEAPPTRAVAQMPPPPKPLATDELTSKRQRKKKGRPDAEPGVDASAFDEQRTDVRPPTPIPLPPRLDTRTRTPVPPRHADFEAEWDRQRPTTPWALWAAGGVAVAAILCAGLFASGVVGVVSLGRSSSPSADVSSQPASPPARPVPPAPRLSASEPVASRPEAVAVAEPPPVPPVAPAPPPAAMAPPPPAPVAKAPPPPPTPSPPVAKPAIAEAPKPAPAPRPPAATPPHRAAPPVVPTAAARTTTPARPAPAAPARITAPPASKETVLTEDPAGLVAAVSALAGLTGVGERSVRGALTPADRAVLSVVPVADPDYTRAQTLLYQDAKGRGATAERNAVLQRILEVPENRYRPELLVEAAEIALRDRNWRLALDRTATAEMHWARMPSDLIFTRRAMIYEIQAGAWSGRFYDSEGSDRDALAAAQRSWAQYKSHVLSRSRGDLALKADERLAVLRDVESRLP